MRWNVYAKRPFGGAEQVIRYLGRYTHRVGISNHRLVTMDERGVTFRTKDGKTVTLSPDAFLGRFHQHVLPDGFVKIRHFGLMAASHATTKLEVARALLVRGACTATSTTEQEFLKSRSALFHVDKIRAPLLIAQGANDPRVKRDESLQIRDSLQKAGKVVEYIEFPDEGHGFARPENRLKFFGIAEKFLARHLGGRSSND